MTDDIDLARRLTEAVRHTAGVSAVFPRQPLLYAAAEGIAGALDRPTPEILVDIEREGDAARATITAHIATTTGRATPDTLRAVAATLRAALDGEEFVRAGLDRATISVTARLIEDPRDD